jgi:hypothetical protein
MFRLRADLKIPRWHTGACQERGREQHPVVRAITIKPEQGALDNVVYAPTSFSARRTNVSGIVKGPPFF